MAHVASWRDTTVSTDHPRPTRPWLDPGHVTGFPGSGSGWPRAWLVCVALVVRPHPADPPSFYLFILVF